MDTFICGSCQMTFNDIEQFVIHKKDCNVNLLPPTSQPETQSGQQVENENVGHVVVSTADSNAEDQVMAFPEGSRVVTTEVVDSVTGEQQTVIIIQPAPGSEMPGSQGVTLDGQTPGSGKKRGRPKKEKQTDSIPVAKVQKVEKPSVPEMGADGKLYCKACKKSFHKERFFKTHRCMPTTDYVDITKKSVLTVEYGENEEAVSASEDEELDNDEDKDFRVSDYKLKDAEEEEDNELEEDGDEEERGEGKPKKKRRSYKVRMDADGDENKGARPTDQIGDVPIFRTEAEKSLFEQSLNVDLSFVDNLFRQHMIEQDLNDKAPVASRMTTNTLSLYSCNMCDKIFKTLSHMRLHCLTHTDSKPFKCPKCPYRSNGKGNLYTHMRKHTGQYFRCKFCDFKSVNKSHVLEHEAVHSNVRHQCDLCKKDYNTLKSLINHIRKYHKNSPKGEEYLSSFLQGGRQRGATVIHQCHVCNRKFKKKIDRDRHLYVHDIKDIPTIQMCSLCDYTASRKVYLEKHFQKHRVIYRCVKCEEKFLSTIRLIDHLTNTHLQDDATTKWESMFEECINNSLYLPEPDEMLSSAEKELVSLPAELSQTDLEGKAKVEVEQVPGETTGTIEAVQGGQDLPMSETEGQNEVKPEVTPSVEEGNIKTEEKDDEQIEDNDLLTSDPQSSSKNENASSQAEEAHLPLADQESSTVNENEDTVLSSTEETGGTSIEENVLEIPKEEKLDSADLIKTLGYRPLTLQVFHKMRETFGHEECEYCGKLYYNKMDYDQHVRTHTGDNPYPCSICGYRALSRDSLQSHKATEHEKLSFPCKECEFTANSRSQLWNHSLKHSGFGEDMGIECPECQQKLPSWTLFKDHVSEAHPDSKNKELNKLHIYAGLESSPKHKVQGKIGRRSYKCPYCDKMFFRANSELQKHIWIHEGVKPFKCPLCPHACRSKNNLQAHMLRHSNEKPYTCTDCNKAYKSKTALRWHVRSHKSGRLFKCSKCPYEATQAAHLRRHMEIHNVIKKYACQHCSYTANTLSYLKVHHTRSHKGVPYKNVDVPVVEETGHDSTGASQVYRCLSCDYLFGNLTDLKRHLKIRHHLTLTNFAGLDGDKSTTITNLTEPVTSFPEESSTTGMMTEVGQDSAVPEINEVHTVDASATEIDSSNLDAKTASAVNILQQIFGMSQQNSGGPQQFTIQSESGEVMTVNPETIIVQEGGEQVLVTDGNQPENGHQQYVIQYVNQDQIENSMVEIQTIQDVQHFQTIEQEIIHSMEAQPLGDNVVEQQIVQS
ncbi:zinc finger protein ZFAT-like isoform X2 [Saccostrea echinata]|uniref:zinc finger protein ZFAT-like isoform X2 n=1 Tax=Saccostrea echinata TaxID=191078 RepID=UPI002A8126BE|nr:zinc finger protein ZFAT-like isoform X2 [Saccostrea echinata]